MSKKWYKVVYKQIQPIHIGTNSYGVIKETRIFITGITMWGALTKAYVEGEKEETYDNNQDTFKNITCFYPMVNGAVLYPRFENGEFYLGNASEKEFRKDFTTTYLSTSINPATLNAQDESLHEIDVILPKDKQNQKELYWVGYIKLDESIEIPKEIYIGGDSRYGLGLMEFKDKIEENYPYDVIKGKYKDNRYPPNKPLLNFLEFNNQEFEGEVELIAEFDFFKGARPKIKQANFYIKPGSKIKPI